MATKITPEKIVEINELYLELGVKAHVARQLGISASTVSKYIIPNYKEIKNTPKTECKQEITLPLEQFMGDFGTLGGLCELFDDEWEDLKQLQKEVTV